ncbi:MAG: universal stress protein [Ignavibacteriae bacterium]|nr:universal stress protein [Ignavibacteriota bacterium]NOG96495.1 universal stress protein [Ignavibacteriota bacterium]
MIRIEKILFPTDFSICSDQVLEHAVYLADKYNAELHIVNVLILFHKYSPIDSIDLPDEKKYTDRIDIQIREQLNKLSSDYNLDNIKIVKKQVRGISEAPAILEYASDIDADLIIMGTHGRRGVKHLFLGSVAEEVVRQADMPVFTIRELEKPKPITHYNNILAPIDFSDHSKKTIQYVRRIAKNYDAKIQLLHVIEDNLPAIYSLAGHTSIYDLEPKIEEKTKAKIKEFYTSIEGAEENYEIFTRVGHPAKTIINFSEENNSDLIVIATHGLRGIDHFLMGSVTEKVVRRSSIPVFTVRAFGKSLIV